MRLADLTGQRFGHWQVLSRADTGTRKVQWECRCKCGTTKAVFGDNLRLGISTSCGCERRNRLTHGQAHTPEFKAWANMKGRCYRPKNNRYRRYGGRGITVCDEWRNDFAAFLAHVGPRPSPTHSLDRWPNCDGNYEPGNVRWATPTEQANNRSKK